MKPFDTWQKDTNFNRLPDTEKLGIYLNFFDSEMADEEFENLPFRNKETIKANFIGSLGLEYKTEVPGIDLAPADYPGGLPEDKQVESIKIEPKTEFQQEPLYDELGLPVAEPSAPKAAGAIIGGMKAFPVSGIAGLVTGAVEPSKDRGLDIPGEVDVGGNIRFNLERAGRTIDEIGSLPMEIIKNDPGAQQLVETAMKPIEAIEYAGQVYGDWVEKNWPDRDEAAEMGALTKSVFEGAVFVGVPWLKAKFIKSVRARNITEIRDLVVQNMDDMVKAGLSEKAILKALRTNEQWEDFRRFKQEAIDRRGKVDPATAREPKVPEKPVIEPEVKPIPESAKPEKVVEAKAPEVVEAEKAIHDYSNTQVNLPEESAKPIKDFSKKIPDKELYTEVGDDSYGREEAPHITVRYGLETVNPKDVEPAFKDVGPIKVKFGKVSIFESDNYDVVKVDVESPDLHEANKKVGETVELPGETFKDYKPHTTIAYVKKGEGKKYVGDKSLEGQETVIDSIFLSVKDGKMHEIKLKPTPAPKKTGVALEGMGVEKTWELSLDEHLKSKGVLNLDKGNPKRKKATLEHYEAVEKAYKSKQDVPKENLERYGFGEGDAQTRVLEKHLKKPKETPKLKEAEKELGEKKTFASIEEPREIPIPQKPKKPIITQEQIKRRAKKKEIKEKQINIESAKEAKEQVRKMIIERRKSLNLSTYETNLFVNDIEKVTTKVQRETIPFIIENTDVPKALKRPDIEKAYKKDKKNLQVITLQVKSHFNNGWQNMKKYIPDMSAEQIENYVTHIWDLNKKQKQVVTNWFITQNRFLKKRYIETLKEGIEKFDLTPRTLDIGEIIRIHDSAMNRAIENKKFTDDLKKLRKDGVPLIERADKAPQDWVYFDHPALRRALVIPGAAKMGEKISPALKSLLDDMGVAIGRRISPVAFGKPAKKAGEYRKGDPPEVRFQRFMSNKTIAHEIGHHLDEVLVLGDKFLNNYKSELYAINRERIKKLAGEKGKYGGTYAESTEEQIAEFFATLFTDADKAYNLAPNATIDVLERLKKDGVLSQLIDFDFEKGAKNLIEEQLNMLVKLPVKVHPDLAKPLKVIFDSRFDHAIIQAYELVNGILKKSVLSLSLFHHAALGEVGITIIGPRKTLNIYLNPGKIYRAMARGEFDIYAKESIARKWIKAGLQVGATHDIPVNMIQNKLNDLARKTKNIPLANKTTGFIATFNETWDKALWNYLHDTLKLYACESLGTKIDAFKDMNKQMTEIAQFVNDTFGGQNWDMLMVSPKTLQIMTWSLLSADWTTSTIRQALSPTGIGAIHKETKGLRRKLGSYFWIKAAIYFGVGINMLNYTFRRWDEKENPQYYKDIKMTFWDRTMIGNTIGKKTNLFVGRYEDGTERYIRWGKQFRELPELFYDDTGFSPISATLKKIGGKLAPVIQQVSQIFTGTSPSGFRNDDVYGKKGWDKTLGIFKTILKSPIPFASRNLLIKDKEFHITDIAFPSSKGMTRYRSIEFFKHAIMKKNEQFLKEVYQETLRNNLPAFTLFNAAIISLKAETTKELNVSRKTIKDLNAALEKAIKKGDLQDIKRIKHRINRIGNELIDREVGIKAYDFALLKMKLYHIEKKEK